MHHPRRPGMQPMPILEPPALHLFLHPALLHQGQDLLSAPRPDSTHPTIQHHHYRNHRDHIRPEQMRPVTPEPVPAPQPQPRPNDEGR